MKRLSRTAARRVVLGVALGGLIALGAGVVTASAASGAAAQPPACQSSQIRVWMGIPGGAAAGSSYFELEFSDVGTTACNLYGFPGVSAVTAPGATLGSPAGWVQSSPSEYVDLTPGETAHTLLQVADVANYPAATCEPTAAFGLRVIPPNQTSSVVIPFAFEACSAAGPVYLHVNEPITAGTGIPQYSN